MGNTFSLTDFCGCGDPCADCCNNCCPGVTLPSAIFATLAGGFGHPCPNGTYELDYNSGSGKWETTQAFGSCGMNFTMKIYCTASGTDCFGYLMDLSFSDGCRADIFGQAPTTCTCSPFSLSYTVTGMSACTGAALLSVTVTT